MWRYLLLGTDEQINRSHLATALADYITAGEVNNAFLSKTKKDTAQDVINFLKGLKVSDKASIDENGNARFSGLHADSMWILELIVNRLQALEGDQTFTESDTIEKVEALDDGTYRLHLKRKWEGYITSQVLGNVLKGTINTLKAGGGTYHTSWTRVNSVNQTNNTIDVAIYPDSDVPGGKNYPPSELMKVVRVGNQIDETRQSYIFLSSTEGRIVKYSGVTKPILDDYSYGFVLGELPDFLKAQGLPLREGTDYLYAQGIVVEDIIRVDKESRPIPTYVDRGLFVLGNLYYCAAINPETDVFETSDTWHHGCKWRCMKNLSDKVPRWNTTDWMMIEGNPEFKVDFEEIESIVDPNNVNVPLTLVATLYNQNITDDVDPGNIQWTRYSEDHLGNPRDASDLAWASTFAARHPDPKRVVLTREDMDMSAYIPRKLRFTCTVTIVDRETLPDGKTGTVTFEY